MKNLVFREDVLAWNYMLEDARKLAEERNVKFTKRYIRIGIGMPESTFGKYCAGEGLRTNFRYYMKYCKLMKRDPVKFFENLIKKILQDREEHPDLYDY